MTCAGGSRVEWGEWSGLIARIKEAKERINKGEKELVKRE